jgi:hypothetical protein
MLCHHTVGLRHKGWRDKALPVDNAAHEITREGGINDPLHWLHFILLHLECLIPRHNLAKIAGIDPTWSSSQVHTTNQPAHHRKWHICSSRRLSRRLSSAAPPSKHKDMASRSLWPPDLMNLVRSLLPRLRSFYIQRLAMALKGQNSQAASTRLFRRVHNTKNIEELLIRPHPAWRTTTTGPRILLEHKHHWTIATVTPQILLDCHLLLLPPPPLLLDHHITSSALRPAQYPSNILRQSVCTPQSVSIRATRTISKTSPHQNIK